MESVIHYIPVEEEVPDYPCLMVHKTHGYVVLFTNVTCGTVVMKPAFGVPFKLGFHHNDWMISHFKPLHGEVRLSQ